MPTDLAQHIQTTPLCDSHEHLKPEDEYVARGPDLVQSLFDNYVKADLIVAGATQPAVDRLVNGSDADGPMILRHLTGSDRARTEGLDGYVKTLTSTGWHQVSTTWFELMKSSVR